MHTGGGAKVIIAGTRKDKVAEPAAHHKVSNIIQQAFRGKEFWGSVVENGEGVGADGRANLTFFPVDNTLGNKDPVIRQIQQGIEKELRQSDFVTAQRPLTWSRALDVVKELGKTQAVLSYEELQRVCSEKCDIEAEVEFPLLLAFLHDAGVVFWLEEPSLRDTVVVDVITAFVKPMTLVICKHQQRDENDFDRYHSEEVHKYCQKHHNSDWVDMTEKGIVSEVLLRALLRDYRDTFDYVVRLMAKFGLLVAMETFSADPSVREDYLVPSLLPARPSEEEDEDDEDWQHSCFFAFDSSRRQIEVLADQAYITAAALRGTCFLPNGLFERMLVKVLEWCQLTAAQKPQHTIHRNVATLMFGGQQLQLRLLPGIHCIKLSVTGANPAAMLARVSQQFEKVIAEVMHSLQFLVLLPCGNVGSGKTTRGATGAEAMFTPLPKLQTMLASGGGATLKTAAGKRGALLSREEMASLLRVWTPTTEWLPRYDLFLSYRWGLDDSLMTAAVFDAVSAFELDGRRLDVFLDTQRLQEGEQLQTQFAKALANSTVVAAFVSSDALQRMVTHNALVEDNVLIEYLLSLSCLDSEASRLSKVFPIFIGARGKNERGSIASIGDLWASGVLAKLPDVVPTASLEKAIALLRANGVAPRPAMLQGTLTVKAIVGEMTSMLAFVPSKAAKESRVVAEFASRLWKILKDVDEGAKAAAAAVAAAAAAGAAAGAGASNDSSGGAVAAPSPSPAPSTSAPGDAASLVDIEKMTAFFADTCGIGSASSQRYAEALVLQHNVATVKRLKYLQAKGKLDAIAEKIGMAEDDLEVLLDELAAG